MANEPSPLFRAPGEFFGLDGLAVPAKPAPQFLTNEKLEHTALAPLFDSRINERAGELAQEFELIVVSNNPLAYSGENLQSDDLASRIWYRGKAEFDDENSPTKSDISLVLTALSKGVFQALHEKQESVLLHPGLFRPSELLGYNYAAPPACLAVFTGPPKIQDLSIYTIPSGTALKAEFGCLHTKAISAYGQKDLHAMWEAIDQRANGVGGIKQDLCNCLCRAAEESHHLLCIWLQETLKIPKPKRSTGIYCCPISPIITTNSGKPDTIPEGVVGMTWITFVTVGEWNDEIRKAADAFVRMVWVVFFSSHVAKRAQAERDTAESEGVTEGIERSIRAMNHELAKQTTVLFSNRLRRLSDIFEVNDLPRTNDAKDVADWPQSAGKVTVAKDIELAVADWQICLAPKLLNAVRSYLILWAGYAGSLQDVGIQSDSLREFFEKAKDIAIAGQIAEKLKIFSPTSLSTIDAVLKDAQTMEETLRASVTLEIDEKDAQLANPTDSTNQLVLSRLFRAIVAGMANAIKYTPANCIISVWVTVDRTGLTTEIRNAYNGTTAGAGYHDGTRGVIEACLQGLAGDSYKMEQFQSTVVGTEWITKFFCPAKASYREHEVAILQFTSQQ